MSESSPTNPAASIPDADKPKIELQDEIVATEHIARIGGSEIVYTATTGRIVMKDEAGKAQATVFFIAYTRKNSEDMQRRPILFSFNGGPGSSSVWLHLGLLGPRRVLAGDAGQVLVSQALIENEHRRCVGAAEPGLRLLEDRMVFD